MPEGDPVSVQCSVAEHLMETAFGLAVSPPHFHTEIDADSLNQLVSEFLHTLHGCCQKRLSKTTVPTTFHDDRVLTFKVNLCPITHD